ncbi:endoglucanase C precursor [mine drainage metagenome]|uniref:Endoglucanase C n=1 Tax=mine drainage metagenome TaxID=410659 RepID=A0A1J5S6R5_9ZZZZ
MPSFTSSCVHASAARPVQAFPPRGTRWFPRAARVFATGTALLFACSLQKLTAQTTVTTDVTVSNNGTYTFPDLTTVSGAKVTLGTSSTLTWSGGGNLTGCTVSGALGSSMILGANTTLTLDSATSATGSLSFKDNNQGATLINAGTLTTQNTPGIAVQTFTNQGTLSFSGDVVSAIGANGVASTFQNSGTVSVDRTFLNVYSAFKNTGTLTVTNNGVIFLLGSEKTADLGSMTITSPGSIILEGSLDNSNATLNPPSGGSYDVENATITGGTISNGAITLGTGDSVTLADASYSGDLSLGTNASVTLKGSADFTGTNLVLGMGANVTWDQATTLAGRTITIGSGAGLISNGSMTIAANTTITGSPSLTAHGSGTSVTNYGQIAGTSDGGTLSATTFINEGTITAKNLGDLSLGSVGAGTSFKNDTGGTIIADGGTIQLTGDFSNLGRIYTTSNGGTIRLSTNSTSGFGSIDVSAGGAAMITSIIDNTGLTLNPPAGGKFVLAGGGIKNGTVASGALTYSGPSSMLDGVSVLDDCVLPASSELMLIDGTSFSGSNISLGQNASFRWLQSGQLTGKSITMALTSAFSVGRYNNEGGSLTLDPATTMNGAITFTSNSDSTITNNGTITHVSGTGLIYGYPFTNNGTIKVTSSTLEIGSSYAQGANLPNSTFVNNGTVISDGGTLEIGTGFSGVGSVKAINRGVVSFQGAITTGNISNVSADSISHIQISGTLDNSNATLHAPSGGTYELDGGTIKGGTISAGAVTFGALGGTIDGAQLGGAITVPLHTSITLTGGVNVSNQSISLGSGASLTFNQPLPYLTSNIVYLAGGSTLTLTTGSLTLDNQSTLSGYGQVILNDPKAIFSNYGNIGSQGSSLKISASAMVNGGKIMLGDNNSISANCPISLGGTVNLEGGTLGSTKGIEISGTVFSDGGTLTAGSWVTIDQNAYFGGDGTINGDLILSGGTLDLGKMGGDLRVSNGSLKVASPSTLKLTILRSYAEILNFLQPTGDIDIGQGKLTLALVLEDVPQTGFSVKIVSVPAGTQFSGTFSNAPTTGSQITANYSGTTYTFRVDYDSSGVTLTYVATPSGSTPSAPSISTQPQNTSVNQGASATFSVVAAGVPAPTYQWQKSGVDIQGATNSSYTIAAASPSDAGSYDVVVSNSQGSVTSGYAELYINPATAAPTISHQPSNVSTSVGGSASFSVSATGNPEPTYQWRKDGVAIAGATGSTYTNLNISASDAGTYTVVVSNSAGSVTSDGATLTVTAASSAPTISQEPRSATVTVGGSAEFSVTATGNPEPTYQWRKDGVAIPGATDSTYSIDTVSASDAGTYDVVVSNSAGSTTSTGATLTVSNPTSAPSITEQPENEQAQVGSTATFSVSATGNPAPTYQWRKDGSAISGATAANLVLSNVQASDSGSYDVVVSNTLGSVTSRLVRLEVTTSPEAPTIDSQPVSLSVIVGQQASFSVEAEGDPAPAYQWTKGGQAIAGATQATFTIPSAQLSDAGTYAVVVSNSSGSVTSQNAALKVYAHDYAGVYFGTIGTDGQFALVVNHDHTGSYLAYLPSTGEAIVQANILVDDSGHFSFQTTTPTTTSASVTSGRLQPAVAASGQVTVDGTIVGNGQLTGSISDTSSHPMTGTQAASTTTAAAAGYYQAASSSSDATIDLIVSGDGRAFVLSQSSSGVSATTGTVDGTGKVTATLAAGESISATVSGSSAKVTLTDSKGSTSLAGGTPAMLEAQHLVGISARALCDTGSNNAVAGFIIDGNEAKLVLIRAVGPGLASQGIAQPIPNPKLELYAGQTLIASNTGWSTASNASEIAAAAARIGDFALSQGSADSAIFTTLQPGLYTANASPSDGKPGVVLVEVYDLSTPSLGNKIVALSSRVEVGTGQDDGVAGFVVSGTAPKQFLIRAVGPTLASYSVSGVLSHPVLKLYQGSTLVTQNTGWMTATNASQIPAAAKSVGEFALQSNDDSALLVTLDPGVYTANVSSGDGTKGVALIEVYEIR